MPAVKGIDLGIDLGRTISKATVNMKPALSHPPEPDVQLTRRPKPGSRPIEVVVVDFDVKFFSLVWILVKFEFASVLATAMIVIPAFLVVALVIALGTLFGLK